MKRHPGITMHKLSFGGGLEGLTFVIGSVLIFVFGLPALWYFVALALILGIGVALVLRGARNRISQRTKPLSLFATAEPTPQHSPRPRHRVRWRRLSRLATA